VKKQEKTFSEKGDFEFSVHSEPLEKGKYAIVFLVGKKDKLVELQAESIPEAITIFNQLIHGLAIEIATEESRRQDFLDEYHHICTHHGFYFTGTDLMAVRSKKGIED